MLTDLLLDVRFRLRRSLTSKIGIRNKPPLVTKSEPERKFYQLLLSSVTTLISANPDSFDTLIDVGCRNWSYVTALADFYPSAKLLGVELDGGCRYVNFYRRMDYANAYVDELTRSGRIAKYLSQDFTKVRGVPFTITSPLSDSPGGQFVLTFFFPFVSPRPCRKWGLPARYSNFQSLLENALKIAPNAHFISSHQGEWEAEIARECYRRVGIQISETFLAPQKFAGLWPSPHPVFLLTGRSFSS